MAVPDLRTFARYLLVAAGVGLFTVALREAIAALMPNLPGQYAWSMLLSYGVGVALSYLVQGRITFCAAGHLPTSRGFAGFTVVAALSALLTALVAYVLRYGLSLDGRWPGLAAPLAFAAAALLAAPVSFLLSRYVVFHGGIGMHARREAWWVWPTLAVLAVSHTMLASAMVMRFNASGLYDEALFMRLARSVVDGAWLGPYSASTLVKGPGFSLWLAAVHTLRLPVALAAAATYSLACLLVFLAMRPLLPSSAQRLSVFVCLLLSPVAFSDFAVMRELIYPALTLLVVACGVGVALRMTQSWRSAAPWCWAAGLGLTSAMFCLTREESVWLLPLWTGVMVSALWAWNRGGGSLAVSLSAMGMVCAFWALPPLVVASLNRHHYGIFTVLEFNSQPFVSAYGALMRVRHADAPPQVPVPREVWGRVAMVSPAFAELNGQLQDDINGIWFGPHVGVVGRLMDLDPAVREWLSATLQFPIPPGSAGGVAFLQANYRNDQDFRRRVELFLGGSDSANAFFSGDMEREIGGGWFVWALRESAAATGHHASALDANRFYQRLADEINTACDTGKLACDAERHTLRPVLQRRYWAPFWSAMAFAARHLVTMPTLSTSGVMRTLGTPAELSIAEAFLHTPLAKSRATLPAVEPFETVIAVYRNGLPWLSSLALVGWLVSTPLPHRRLTAKQWRLWLLGGLLLVLVSVRLALLALIHVTSWPAASDVRYLSVAQPVLIFFDAVGLLLLASWWPHANQNDAQLHTERVDRPTARPVNHTARNVAGAALQPIPLTLKP